MVCLAFAASLWGAWGDRTLGCRHRSGGARQRAALDKSTSCCAAMARALPVSTDSKAHVLRDIPALSYPPELPVAEHRQEIAGALRDHQVIIVAGETGSGKTTQLPKICMELGRGRIQRIGHTQPRRLAARTVAQRIAEEVGLPLGDLIGYQVRFQEHLGERTAVKLMTDGILLSEMQRDRDLRQYDTLIIDEAHERSLNIDFILGYLRRLLPRRPDLKVLVTSATIDVQRFSEHFDNAPVIEVSGRSYPVTTHYLSRDSSDSEDLLRQVASVVKAVQAGVHGEPGDMLVFLSGERDIRDVARQLKGAAGLDVLPLYARLSQGEQARVFGRSSSRGLRVVLSTNVAETSVTVPGIRFVIDPGEARISRYSYRTRVQRLPIEPVSRASADQRRGRCGRVGPGVCLRLYTEEDYLSRPEFTDPEIKRSNLAAVVLQMLQLGLGDISKFPFLEPPDTRLIRDGYRLLDELGAVNQREQLTRLGRRMAAFPIDPALSRMVLSAQEFSVLPEMLVIASALSIQDPRERPTDRQAQADQSHARFADPRSDFMSLLNLWRYYEEQRQELSENKLRKLCKREYLSWLRMREWRDVHRQISIACRSQGLKPSLDVATETDYAGVHRSLLTGLLGNIAQQDERREYLAARNRRLQLFPGSAVYRKPPKWLVAGEIVETQRVYARSAASIEAQWLMQVNPALLKHQYYEPRWQREQGRVVAWRRTSLFGLTVSDRVAVQYAKIDPALCRELLIREALISGRWSKPPAFLKYNLRLQREVEDLESRVRRRDLLVDEETLFQFYDERLPANATNTTSLSAWLKEDDKRTELLKLRREQLLTRDPGALTDAFPDRLEWEGQSYKLSYQFSPGKQADGVSITVPLGLLNRLPRFRLQWLVPGVLREKCLALVKALPKSLRKQLVPVPDWVDRALANMEPGDQPLNEALASALRAAGGPRIDASEWATAEIDDYYLINLRVVDEKNKLLAQGRDVDALIAEFQEATREHLTTQGGDSPARVGLTSWDFQDLEREYAFRQAGVDIRAYPALDDGGDTASIALFDYPGEALLAQRRGLARLLMLSAKPLFRDLRKRFLKDNATALLFAALDVSRDELLDDLLPTLALNASGLLNDDCREKSRFDAAAQQLSRTAITVANELEAQLKNTLVAMVDALQILQRHQGQYSEAKQDLAAQRKYLLSRAGLFAMASDELRHYPRYAKAMVVRAERLAANYRKDQEHQATLAALEAPMHELLRETPGAAQLSSSLYTFQTMLQELRVSLFAQHLGTSRPVSVKRLNAQWALVDAWQKRTSCRSPEE
ncbi:ATP-dependent RNA helicase HrpA [Congregibacter brevis]|uniref:ATP-dependent RNA helicase HrpA n=1 Tax=Congregibacter brevis TaxID=3081201 RepID=A0ABZ0IAE5_9GAMM|nr:ATP-dependent RNA helicase HrpA [Congregibacter sp. IMCC45268]